MSGIAVTSIENCKRRYALQTQGYDFREVVRRVGELFELDADAILIPGKQPRRAHARGLACYWAVRELGMTAVAVARWLGISQPAVTRAAGRGRDACK